MDALSDAAAFDNVARIRYDGGDASEGPPAVVRPVQTLVEDLSARARANAVAHESTPMRFVFTNICRVLPRLAATPAALLDFDAIRALLLYTACALARVLYSHGAAAASYRAHPSACVSGCGEQTGWHCELLECIAECTARHLHSVAGRRMDALYLCIEPMTGVASVCLGHVPLARLAVSPLRRMTPASITWFHAVLARAHAFNEGRLSERAPPTYLTAVPSTVIVAAVGSKTTVARPAAAAATRGVPSKCAR